MKMPFYFTRVGQASRKFSRRRADWYEYLADMTEDTQGRRTLLSVLEADAVRYGSSARGILSRHWAHRIAETGDIGRTLHGTLPAREVAEFAALQRQGQQVFAAGLRDMASVVRLSGKLGSILLSTLFAAGVAFAVLWAFVMLAIPYVTVPMLLDSMPDIPRNYLTASSRALIDLAEWIRGNGPQVWLGSLALVTAFQMSFRRFDGPIRRWLDTWGPYKLYRDVNAIGVISTTATAVRPRSGHTPPLRAALDSQQIGASPWLARRLQTMQHRLDDARSGAAIFDVGLLDREAFWYLEDLTSNLGLDVALQKTRARMEQTILKQVERRAAVLRWTVLLLSVLSLAAILIWHQSVIFDLRNAALLDSAM